MKAIAILLFVSIFAARLDRTYYYGYHTEALLKMMREIGHSFGL